MNDRISFLKDYDGPKLRLMEVCGTHTAQIAKCGIRQILSPQIELISGPGCPVCVTVSDYIDKLIELANTPNTVVASFGDMLRVPGSKGNLRTAQAGGAKVQMVYSPMDMLKLAEKDPDRTYIFAAVGFETTTPVYALLIQEAKKRNLKNVKLLTSLKVMPPVIDWICENQGGVDGFLAPGHVSVITGSKLFEGLAEKYQLPFVVAGFEGEELISAIYALVRLQKKGIVMNMYPSAVTENGNEEARNQVNQYFEPGDAVWRGMGCIPGSGMQLRPEYMEFDAGSSSLVGDYVANPACHCAEVLTGKIHSEECPLFGSVCTVDHPQGACMVSMEGSCFNRLTNRM